MSNERPRIKLSKTKSEWAWNIIGYSFYLGSVIYLIITWNLLPNELPAHYNALGEVDRWGTKWELIILPIVGAFIIVLMEVLEKYPEVHNYPQRFNESNVEKFYLLSRKLVNQFKNICLIIIALILFESVSIALGWGNGFGMWFLPIMILGTGVPIVVGIIKQKKLK
jgi:uncharacterized membrane protein